MKILLLAIAIVSVSFMSNAQTKKQPTKMLRHAVLFKFKDTSSLEDIKKVEDAFRALPSKIKGCPTCPVGYSTIPAGFVYSIAIEDDGVDVKMLCSDTRSATCERT